MIEPVEIEQVDWLDPRAVALRSAMDAETGAMYAAFTAERTPEQVAAIDDALTVDPASSPQPPYRKLFPP